MFPTRLLEGRDELPEEGAKNLVKNDATICGSCTNEKKLNNEKTNANNSASTRVSEHNSRNADDFNEFEHMTRLQIKRN